MKKNSMMILLVVLVFCLSCISISGCAKKSTIKDAAAISAEESAARERAAAEARQKVAEPAAEEKIVKPAERVSEQALKKEAEQKQVIQEPVKEVVRTEQLFENIYFDYDKVDLNSASRIVLEGVAKFLQANGKYLLRVEGHCDERGTAEYNLALGQRRAEEAMKYLVKLGIDDGRISTLSYGKELPLDPASTEEAWAKNRRDNFVPILTK